MAEHKCEMGDRCDMGYYIITINGTEPAQALCQSIGEALRKAGNLRLKETDIIEVKRKHD